MPGSALLRSLFETRPHNLSTEVQGADVIIAKITPLGMDLLRAKCGAPMWLALQYD